MIRPAAKGTGPVRHELGPAVEALTRVARILERASGDLGLPHYRVLVMVAAGNGRASRLAGRLALGKPAISAAVESLVARGLLVRSGSDPDRRATQLEITAQGKAVVAAAESAMSAELADLLGRTSDPAGTLAALRNLSTALDWRQADRDAKASERSQMPGSRS